MQYFPDELESADHFFFVIRLFAAGGEINSALLSAGKTEIYM